ncbi:hypothetical protein ACFL1H_00480 [Nanoarchaeota archaeon]
MEELEMQVREKLIELKADEIYETIKKPEYSGKIENFVRNVMNSLISKFENDFGMEKEEVEEAKSTIEAHINNTFSNDDQLKQVSYQQAQNRYLSREQINNKFNDFYKELKDDEDFGEEALEKYKQANETLFNYIEHSDKIINETVKITESKSIDIAVSQESQDEITRKLFPTAEEYIDFNNGGFKAVKDYYKNLENAMSLDGELGEIANVMITGVQSMMKDMKDMLEQIQKERIESDVIRIYD